MKIYATILALLASLSSNAQLPSATSNLKSGPKPDVVVPFSYNDEGKRLPIEWGFDLAWLSEDNLHRGINFAGKDLCDIVRVSFRPTESVASGSLGTDQKAKLKQRAEWVKKYCKEDVVVNLNDDHESVHDYYKITLTQNYNTVAKRWAKMMDLHLQSYVNDYGLKVVSVSPINEVDYDYHAHPTQDYNTRKLLFKSIDNILVNDYKYRDLGYRICGGNTLNDDKAYEWWNYLKENLDEGNTHQLAGDFAHYADFFKTVRAAGHHATNDELHNTMEAMVGVEYGMQTGIWWGTADYCRSQFMKASNKGVRLGYGEHRNNWTAASVYRYDNGTVNAFVGSSERQAYNTRYGIACLDEPIWIDGSGPYYEYPLFIPGGTGYQVGQSNAETLVNVQSGDDIQPEIPTGYVTLINKSKNNATAIASLSKWYVTRVPEKIGGDYSGFFFFTNDSETTLMDLNNFGLNEGTSIIQYPGNHGNQEQWHLQYAGQGWFYIISRHSGMCIDASTGRTKYITGADSQKWRLVPYGTKWTLSSSLKNYLPADFTVTAQAASIKLDWKTVVYRNSSYNNHIVQRSSNGGQSWSVIAQNVKGNTFVDNTVVTGQSYLYRIALQDYGFSDMYSAWVTSKTAVSTTGAQACMLNLDMDKDVYDQTIQANHPALYGDTTLVDGKTGKAFKFVGSQYLTLPHTIAHGREFTFMTWVYWLGGTSWMRLFDFGNGTDQYFFLSPNANSNGITRMRVAIKDNSEEYTITCPNMLPQRKWVHVAVTVSDQAIAIYLNGEKVVEDTSCKIRPADFKPMQNFIGRSQFIADPLFSGTLDEIRMYNFSMTAEQIAAAYNGVLDSDANEDGELNLQDVNYIVNCIVNPSKQYQRSADVNRDNKIDILDQTITIDKLNPKE